MHQSLSLTSCNPPNSLMKSRYHSYPYCTPAKMESWGNNLPKVTHPLVTRDRLDHRSSDFTADALQCPEQRSQHQILNWSQAVRVSSLSVVKGRNKTPNAQYSDILHRNCFIKEWFFMGLCLTFSLYHIVLILCNEEIEVGSYFLHNALLTKQKLASDVSF